MTPAGERALATPLLGRGNLANVLAATAVALECGVPLDVVAARAATLRPADRRGAVRRLTDGVTAHRRFLQLEPGRAAAGARGAGQRARRAGRVAVLGEMLELGDHADALHRDCGRRRGGAGLRLLFAVGGAAARALADAAVDAGMPAGGALFRVERATPPRAVSAALRPAISCSSRVRAARGCDVVVDRIVAERG